VKGKKRGTTLSNGTARGNPTSYSLSWREVGAAFSTEEEGEEISEKGRRGPPRRRE